MRSYLLLCEFAYEVILVGEQVRDVKCKLLVGGLSGMGDEQPLGSARTEPLDQPQNPERGSRHGLCLVESSLLVSFAC